jgi:Zn-dependent protease with chaperone function
MGRPGGVSMGRAPVLALLVLPLLLAGWGGWQLQRGSATRAELAGLAAELPDVVDRLRAALARHPGAMVTFRERPYPASMALGRTERRLAEIEDELVVARWRLPAAWLVLAGGLAAALAGGGTLLLAAIAARRGLASRAALVAGFGRLYRLLPFAIGAQVVGITLALLAAVGFEVSGLYFLDKADDGAVKLVMVGLVAAGAAAWGAVVTLRDLRRALRLFELPPIPLLALPVAEAEAPGLFALLRDLSRQGGAAMPGTVTVGLVDGFFVTSAPRLVGEAVLPGRTLHLPLAGMAMLDPVELRSVLAHELAHFSGEDTDYSIRFQPLYAGLEQSAAAMAVRREVWGGTALERLVAWLMHPQTALALHVLERFHLAVRHWSRQRELEADRAAARAGSAEAVATSLLRLGLVQELQASALDAMAAAPEAAPADLPAALLVQAAETGLGDPAAHLGDSMPHPTDTHPPSRLRIEALGLVPGEALLARAARPVAPAESAAIRGLFADWDGLARRATAQLRARAEEMQAAHQAALEATAGAVGETQVALYEAPFRPWLGVSLLVLACLLLMAAAPAGWAWGNAADQAALGVLAAVSGVGLLGLGGCAVVALRLWRGRHTPYLVVAPEGMTSPGWTGLIPWSALRGLQVPDARGHVLTLVLRDDAVLPARTGRIRRITTVAWPKQVRLTGLRPRRMRAAEVPELLIRYAEAEAAREALRLQAAAEARQAAEAAGTPEEAVPSAPGAAGKAPGAPGEAPRE